VKLTDSDILRKLRSYFAEGDKGNRPWRTRGRRAKDFYVGKQWDEKDLALLKSEERPALTINEILPIVNLISGLQRQNRQQVKVYPRKGGNAPAADILTELCKHTADISNADYEQSMMFLDGYTTGKGWLELNISYEDDPFNGEILISRRSPFEMIEDPNAKEYDLNKTAKYIIRPFWWDKESIKMSYPKKEKEIAEGLAMMEADLGLADIKTVETDTYQEEGQIEGTDPKEFRYRVKDNWWRTYEKRRFLINVTNLEMKLIHDDNKDIIKKIMAKATVAFNPKEYRIKEIVVPVLHQTVTLGGLILENNDDPLNGVTKYPFYRFCPYWIDGYIFGGVENLESPQQEENKRASQLLHHLNQSANSGWIGPKGWEVENEEDVKAFGSKPGVSIHYNENKKPEKILPTQLSQGHLVLEEDAKSNLRTISGVNPNLLGERMTKQESGVAIRERKQQGMVTSEIVFDNFNYTLQLFNTALCDMIRKTDVYSESEIMAIVQDRHLDKVNIDTLKTFKFGKYGIKISQNPNLPTVRLENFEMLLKAVQAGLPIQAEHLIELSDLPNKTKILEDLRAQKEMLQQQAQAGGLPQGGAKPGQRGGQ